MADPTPSDFAAAAFCYLTTTGRHTGRAHTIEIWFAVDGNAVYMMAGGRESTDWVRNLAADSAIVLRIDDTEWDARARIVDAGSAEDARVRPLLRDKYATSDDDLVSWARTALPVALEDFRRRAGE
jgi:deazaflavin-dependent oxidoreductase (nitroreductase family)